MSNCRMLRKSRGFTLIELMLVVAITSITAALAIYSISAYLEHARSAEAKNFVRAISKGAQSAYERETSGANVLVDAADMREAHSACESAQAVPQTVPEKGHKYQPNTAEGSDFQTGDTNSGWKCVKFQTSQPIYYQYSYFWQDTAVTVAQQDWERDDFSGESDHTGERNFMPATFLMAANPPPGGGTTNNHTNLDGDYNNGHGNNDDGCDPDNPGKGPAHCRGGDDGSSGDGSSGDGSSGNGGSSNPEPAGAVEPWCVSNCFEAGAKDDNTIFLVVTELTDAGLSSRTVMLYRK